MGVTEAEKNDRLKKGSVEGSRGMGREGDRRREVGGGRKMNGEGEKGRKEGNCFLTPS